MRALQLSILTLSICCSGLLHADGGKASNQQGLISGKGGSFPGSPAPTGALPEAETTSPDSEDGDEDGNNTEKKTKPKTGKDLPLNPSN